MARVISAELLAAQMATKRKPYKKVVINSIDYSSRVLFIEHHEEPYRDWATIILDNHDRGLDAVATATTNLLGYRFRIGNGHYTGNNVAEPDGDNAGHEYSYSADLWVKKQQMISSPGQLVCQLYCEGQWMYLREQRVMALANAIAIGDPAFVGDDPYYLAVFDRTKTPYQLIESTLESAMGWTFNATPSPDDGILNTFRLLFSLEELPYAATILRDLIMMTKCYLRPKANLIWEIVYPQDSDEADETYYSDQAHYFYEYAETLNLVIPNRIVVFAGNPENLIPWPTPVIVGDTGAYSGNYVEVLEPHLAATIISQVDANNRAAAIKTRYRAEQLAGYLIIPHDARVELYDKAVVDDVRGK